MHFEPVTAEDNKHGKWKRDPNGNMCVQLLMSTHAAQPQHHTGASIKGSSQGKSDREP